MGKEVRGVRNSADDDGSPLRASHLVSSLRLIASSSSRHLSVVPVPPVLLAAFAFSLLRSLLDQMAARSSGAQSTATPCS